MKKLCLYAVLLVTTLSVQKKETAFHGIGSLTLGAKLNSLAQAKSFRLVMDGEYYSDKFHLSDAVGTVSHLNVSTANGQIEEVKFTATEQTNTVALQEIISHLIKGNDKSTMLSQFKDPFNVLTYYATEDKKVLFFVTTHKKQFLKNGQPLCEYSYLTLNASNRKGPQILKNTSKK